MDLINEYGPLGSTIFDCVLCMIYREGYYLELPMDKLCLAVIKSIGSKWVKKHQVMQVIQYCADIGLFDKSLLARSVVTSAGLQRRYAEVTSRNKVDKSLYWLIENENGQPLINAPKNSISAAKKAISATEMRNSDAEMQQEKEIRNKNKRESIAAAAAAPTLEDVKAYAKGKCTDPEKFWRRYESVGWMRAGNPILNWKLVFDEWDEQDKTRRLSDREHSPSYDLDAYEKFDTFTDTERRSE